MTDEQKLLRQVHRRLGGLGVDIQTFGEDHTVSVRWYRSYDGELSDERMIDGFADITSALEAVLACEDAEDLEAAAEEELADSP